MALSPRRRLFGRQPGDWTGSIDSNGFLKSAPNTTLWVYTAETGGSRITDLQAKGGAAIDELVTDSVGTIPEFYGPEDVTRVWVGEPESSSRSLLVATDWGDDVKLLDAAIDDIEVQAGVQSVNGLFPDDGDLSLAPGDLSPPAPSTTDLDDINALIGARVLQDGTGYPPRPSNAVFAIWVGTVDPGAAAVDGDIWLQPETT